MSVIIRREGFAYTWTCKTLIEKNGETVFCNHVETAASDDEAREAYRIHQKRTAGH